MFQFIQNLLNALFSDITNTFKTLFAIGALFCGIMIFSGNEENVPRFKRSLLWCIVGFAAFLLVKPMLQYLDKYL
ncbi:MAG TPA: hypothetical protein VEY70_18460 [Metabacillus sp.]|nr:hypothetical protein [Metabacillus sp.]